jgi:hypothetical protein
VGVKHPANPDSISLSLNHCPSPGPTGRGFFNTPTATPATRTKRRPRRETPPSTGARRGPGETGQREKEALEQGGHATTCYYMLLHATRRGVQCSAPWAARTTAQTGSCSANTATARRQRRRSASPTRCSPCTSRKSPHYPRHHYDYSLALHVKDPANIKIIYSMHGTFARPPPSTGCPQCEAAARKAARQRRHLKLLAWHQRRVTASECEPWGGKLLRH